MFRTMRLINNQAHNIAFTDEAIAEHFNNGKNCTNEILHQFGVGRIYDGLVTSEDRVILDIGANIGLFALHVSPYARRLCCVEPTPCHFNLMKKLTAGVKEIECLEAALSRHSGEVDFYEFGTNTTMNTLFSRDGSSVAFRVKSYSLVDLLSYFKLDHVDFCKIDIEGSEILALDESVIGSVSGVVKKFFIEFHEYMGVSYTQSRELYKSYFEKYGYKVEYRSVDALYCYK